MCMASLFQIEQLSNIQAPNAAAIGFAELTGVKKVLAEFAQKVTANALKNLQEGGTNASFALSQSIDPLPVRIMGKDYMVEIEMADYWKFVNEGVRGRKDGSKSIGSPFQYTNKMPPRASIEQWITNKGINPGGRRGERLDPRASLAMVIQRRIFNFGTPRTLFFDKALPESLQKALVDDVAEALGKQISISIKL